MDQGTIGSIYTVVVFVAFIGACFWAFSGRNKQKFDEAANSIMSDDDIDGGKQQKLNDQES